MPQQQRTAPINDLVWYYAVWDMGQVFMTKDVASFSELQKHYENK